MSSPLRKPEGISWGAASVELPPMPAIPPGADAMSMTIAAVLPTLEAAMTANVTSLAAKENTFSGKVGAAQAAYNVGDESAGQSVGQSGDMLGQLTGQLGQLAQMPQQAASSLGGGQGGGGGGQGGGFGQLMQQAMQAAQGAVQQGTQAAQQGQEQEPGGPAGGPPPGVSAAPTPEQRDNEQNAREEQQNQREDQQDQRQVAQDARDQQQDQRQSQLDSREDAAAGPSAGGSTAGPAPVTPPGPSRPTTGGEDLSTRV
jgi:hypothetical protein